MAINKRQREMAVLRAVGATPSFVFRLILVEAVMLALGGAIVGIGIAASGFFIFKDMIATLMKMPFLFPSVSSFLGLFAAGVALVMITVAFSALIPAIRISRQELAIAMRE